MERLIRRYYKLWGKIWYRIVVMTQERYNFDPSLGHGEVPSFIPLTVKHGHTDMRPSHQSGSTALAMMDWDDLQDRIMRVLTYKYNETNNEIATLYFNPAYPADTGSISCFEEEFELENQLLFELDERASRSHQGESLEISVVYNVLPRRQEPERVLVNGRGRWKRFWGWWRSAVTMKQCRRRTEE